MRHCYHWRSTSRNRGTTSTSVTVIVRGIGQVCIAPPEAHAHGPESFLPLVYDYQGMGGWRLPYVVRRPGVDESDHRDMLKAILAEHRENTSHNAKRVAESHTYDTATAALLTKELWASF